MRKEPTDLDNWIAYKYNHYNYPGRKGTPKGKSYPIPKHKYHAALLHLLYAGKQYNFRQIAEDSLVSYELLSKWRTEDRFRNLVIKLARQYVKSVMPPFTYQQIATCIGISRMCNSVAKTIHVKPISILFPM